MLATKEKTSYPGEVLTGMETRVWGVMPENPDRGGPVAPLSSTAVWGSTHFYSGTASGQLVPVNYYDPLGTNRATAENGPGGMGMECNFPIEGMAYVCFWYPVGGGAGAGSSGTEPPDPSPSVSDQEMKLRLSRGLKRAGDALSNPDCAGLFGGGPYPDPIKVLSQLSNSFTFGPIEDKTNPDGTKTITSATTTGSGSVMYGYIPVNTSVTINLNNTSAGASFVSGNVNDWAITILHELGHAFYDLYGSAASKITPDGDSTAKSEANTALVKEKCKL